MSNEDDRMTWWRDVRVARVAQVARVALCGALLCGALWAAGCTTVSNPRSCADGFCHDPALPFCDVDGTIAGGQRLTCIAVECTPLELAACRGDEAIVCNATGDDYDVTHCEGGCDAGTGGCAATHIIPRYLPTVCDQLAPAPELTIAESMTLDTNIDANCNGGVVPQAAGPAICVLRYGKITLDRNRALKVTGSRALALVADEALTIDGILDVSADGFTDGPGGGFVTILEPTPIAPAGGGGIGFRTKGGSGGDGSGDGAANNGGAASMDPALLVDLVGAPGRFSVLPGFGSGAGGAATMISCRDTVSILGMIDAGGGGGRGGAAFLFEVDTATGGGAGGNVVLQGMMVKVTGQVFANGGGGGAGCQQNSGNAPEAHPGADGTRSDAEPAQGGAPTNQGEGAGGAGGLGTSLPGLGKRPTAGNAGAGAGGGSTGFFQAYMPASVTPMLMPAAASPAFQTNRTIPTR